MSLFPTSGDPQKPSPGKGLKLYSPSGTINKAACHSLPSPDIKRKEKCFCSFLVGLLLVLGGNHVLSYLRGTYLCYSLFLECSPVTPSILHNRPVLILQFLVKSRCLRRSFPLSPDHMYSIRSLLKFFQGSLHFFFLALTSHSLVNLSSPNRR